MFRPTEGFAMPAAESASPAFDIPPALKGSYWANVAKSAEELAAQIAADTAFWAGVVADLGGR